jgi:glutamate/tyrosine decarboxylase-like PLP-dependent enzyme
MGHNIADEGLWNISRIPVLSGAPHVSILKVLSILGMERKSMEYVSCLPDRQVIDPVALAERLETHKGQPAIVIASAGEVNTGDFDDLEAVAALCRRYGAWLHIDGAFGLFAACDPSQEIPLNSQVNLPLQIHQYSQNTTMKRFGRRQFKF